MFHTLTEDERYALYLKLLGWEHKFFEIGHALAKVALAAPGPNDILWDRRQPYIDARAELCELDELVKP